MKNWKLAVFSLAATLLCGVPAKADPVVLTFEGVGNLNAIGDFYNGGAGGNLGISFAANSLAVVSSLDGGSGNIANTPSGDTAAFFLNGTGDLMNVAAGFSNGFSFFYSSVTVPGQVTVWSGLNGTGTLLATLDLAPTGFCSPGPNYCNWQAIGVSFNGIAESVNFSGTANQIAFDNITIGSATAGGGPTATPEPATIVLLAIGSAGAVALRRRKLA
jgi:hypothetical protein